MRDDAGLDIAAAAPAPPPGEAAGGDMLARVRALAETGIATCVFETAAGFAAGGATLQVDVAPARMPECADAAFAPVEALLRQGMPLTLCLRGFGSGDAAIDALEAFCTRLRDRLHAEDLTPDGVGLSVPSHVVPLEAYLVLTTALLGRGPRYVLLDGLQMRPHDDPRARQAAEHNWSFLWRHRAGCPSLTPAYAASVTTRCPLLGDEAATAVLPERGLQVPVGSAWLPLVLDLPNFGDGRGRLCWERLRRALEGAVDTGEALHDRLAWPAGPLRRDARENRRLAVEVRGLGDLLVERGADPRELASLRFADGIVRRLQAILGARSRALAHERGPLPSLVRSEPVVGWRCDRRLRDWQLTWRRALAESAVRHRNLLVLSPYSVLPRGTNSASAWLDLLPVLHHADAFAFAAPPAEAFRHPAEFARFHRRAWAVMQRRNAASFVAAGV